MTAILIVAHAPLASALKAVAAHVYPEAPVEAVDVSPAHTPERVADEVRARLRALGWAEVLVLADMAGGTPCNGLRPLLAEGTPKMRVVAGANVPMLWRAICYGSCALDDLQERALVGGRMGIVPMGPATPPQQQGRGPDDPHPHHDQ